MDELMKDYATSFFEFGEEIVVAVSGGRDSMMLLHCLMNSSKKLNLIVAHLNHCLRGKESDRDEEFIRSFCEKHNLRFLSKREDIKKFSKENKISIEEAGRIKRYEFFNSFGRRVATAHSLSDLVETFFLNILRGCGLKGLVSIPQKRGKIIRPLLRFTRDEIGRYCKINDVKFVDDSSNLQEKFLRNNLRLNVIPKLKNISFDFEKKILRMIDIIKYDEKFLDSLAKEKFQKAVFNNSLDLKYINKLDQSIKTRIILIFLKENQVTPTSEIIFKILNLCKKGMGRCGLYGDFMVSVKRGRMFIEKNEKVKNFQILLPKTIEFSYKNLYFIRCDVKEYDDFLNKFHYLFLFKFDYDKIVGEIYLRSKKEKDKIKLKKRPTKTLKALMQEKRLTTNQKNRVVLLSDDVGVFWAFGFGVDVRVLPDEFSKNLCLVFEKL